MWDNSVTISKGIAILLMVLAHTYFLDYGCKWINMFHMPLFFFFAGYCMKERYLYHFREFAMRRIKGLYVPYVKWCLIFLLLHNVFYCLNIYNNEYGFRGVVSHIYGWQDFVVNFLRIIRMGGNEQLLGGYWFLKTLFYGSIFGYFTIRYCKSYRIMGGVALLVVTMLLSAFNIHIPFLGIGTRETLAACFYCSGYWYKYGGYCFHTRMWVVPIGICAVSAGAVLWQATVLHCEWWQVFPYFFSALAGVFMIFYISCIINQIPGRLKDF